MPLDTLWTSQAFDTLGALAGVLLIVFAVAWLLKRTRVGQPAGQHLRVISVLPLSTKERVVLIQAGEEQVLMGVSAAGIQHLHTLSAPVSLIGADPASPESGSMSAFREVMRAVVTRSST